MFAKEFDFIAVKFQEHLIGNLICALTLMVGDHSFGQPVNLPASISNAYTKVEVLRKDKKLLIEQAKVFHDFTAQHNANTHKDIDNSRRFRI